MDRHTHWVPGTEFRMPRTEFRVRERERETESEREERERKRKGVGGATGLGTLAMPRDGQIACAEARGSGWVPQGTPPYHVNAQGRANCRHRGPPRAKEEERERERERMKEGVESEGREGWDTQF